MGIVFALIEKNQEEAKKLALLLAQAVDKGSMAAIDQYLGDLLGLASPEPRFEVPEDQWRQFLTVLRQDNPQFISSYVLNRQDMETIVSSALPDSCRCISVIAKEGLEKNALLLELPLDE